MASTKPRVNVTLEPEDYELLRRVSLACGSSMSSMLRDYLIMSRPLLERVAGLGEAFKVASEERRAKHKKAVDGVLGAIGPSIDGHLEAITGDFEALFTGLMDAVEDRSRSALGEGRREGTPGIVTRGSGQKKSSRKGVS